MALGGGTFTTQNKVLPGAYINVISAAGSVVTMGERGTVALPIALNWSKSGVFTVTADEFLKDSMKIFGYSYTADEMQALREVFKHAQKVQVYNLNDNGGAAATCTYATAKCTGTRGNDLKLVIQKNIDNTDKFDVTLYMGTSIVYQQTVATAAELGENAFVTWTDTELAETAGTVFSGGTNGTTEATSYQNALNAFEPYRFNVLVCPDSETYGSLYVEYTKRMRDKQGIKFQLVCVDVDADYEGVISIDSEQANALYWVAGAQAGCAINQSCTNKIYDGELTIATPHTQTELENCILSGVFAFHKVDDEVRVLMDVNTLVTYTDEKDSTYAHNQKIRVADQKHNDVKRIFNTKYLGKIQNDSAGRASFWGDVVKLSNEYAQMRAIEPYDSKTLTVELGEKPNSVVVRDAMRIIGTMEQLYMTIVC